MTADFLARFTYPFLYVFAWLISLQPMWLLHFWSRILAYFMGNVVGYRKKVVLKNLQDSFPEKSPEELQALWKEFYLHFSDVLVETLKLLSISSSHLKRRVRLVNPERIHSLVPKGQGAIVVFSHYGNWEWLGSGLALHLPGETVGVYQTLKSKAFDRLVLSLRTRLGNKMVPQQEAVRAALSMLKTQTFIGMLGDQTPAPQGKRYFSPFLGRPAAVHLGIATLVLKTQCPFFYADIRREKRGHYSITLLPIPYSDLDPKSKESVFHLTDRHVEILEGILREAPGPWLWSHRRWKREIRPEDVLSPKLISPKEST